MKKPLSTLLFAAAVAFAGAAFAQGNDPVAILATQTGEVSVSSDGGTFTAAATGQGLQARDRLMLVEGSTATLRFDNNCTVRFDKPGVYNVPTSCKVGAVAVDWQGAAIIAGGVGVVAAALASMDTVPAPPESR